MKVSTTISADGTVTVGYVDAPRSMGLMWAATLFCYGTFGSGTVALKWSPDGGTTKLDLVSGGVPITFTANGSTNIELGVGDTNSTQPIIYAVTTGSTAPDITVGFYDVR